jgi:hypothetical protein
MLSFLRPLPRRVTAPLSYAVLIAWVAMMAILVHHAYLQASSATLATDLGRYGASATWRGVYYRGEKIGFTVNQTVKTGDGFDLDETGRLQMSLLGATTAATIRTTAHVDAGFALRAFEFSLDPGTGPIEIRGRIDGLRLTLDVTTPSGTRSEERTLGEAPALSLNISRRLANGGLVPGSRHQWTIFDPATLRNAPVTLVVGRRELVRSGGAAPIPAFRVDMEFSGLRTTSWITDTGEVVREESPLGLITVRESAEQARGMAVSGRMRLDLLAASAVVPRMKMPIAEPRDVRVMRLRLGGVSLSAPDMDGVNQRVDGDVLELRDPQSLRAGRADPDVAQFLRPEPFIESDAPEIVAEAKIAIGRAVSGRARAEALTRYVNALLDKKPTVSLPSAREVLRTKVGDCNEHTALYVAMARAIGIPARIAVGLVYVHGAFYYHAWPEVYVEEGAGGLWLPVDPTLNQFPADATHLRLARGGLDKQAAIVPMIGHLTIDVLQVELAPGSNPILVGREAAAPDLGALAIPIPHRDAACCRCGEAAR